MSPLLPLTLAIIVGILLAELPAMAAFAVLGVLSLTAATWFLLRRPGWGWTPVVVCVWVGYILMQLMSPTLPMHTGEASRRVRALQQEELSRAMARSLPVREACCERLTAAGLDTVSLSLARGILFGDRRAVDADLRDGMREAGMSHILAVSGLHVGILFGVILVLLMPLRWIGKEWLRLLLSLVFLWAYIVLIGMPASACRAALMATVATLSWFNHSSPWGWHNLTVAAFLLLLWKPWWLWDLGFQLSFLATAGIMAFLPAMQASRDESWLWSRLRGLFWLTVSAQLATLPLVAHVFGHLPLLGILQGFVVVPLLPFYVGALLLLLVIPALGPWVSPLVNGFTAWISGIAGLSVQGEHLLLGGRLEWSPSLPEMCIAYLGIIAFALWWRQRTFLAHESGE